MGSDILIQSYLIGLWFSLRTHASQIWQNPQQLMHPMELPVHNRLSLYQRLVPTGNPAPGTQRGPSLHRKYSNVPSRTETPAPREVSQPVGSNNGTVRSGGGPAVSPGNPRRVSYATGHPQPGYTPVLETVDRTVKDSMHVPETMTTDDFTRAVAVATVSALRHQQAHSHSPARVRTSGAEEGGHGGHDAPSWSRTTSASVLLVCTALYAIIAGKFHFNLPFLSDLIVLSPSIELLVDVVDVILEGSGIDEKFLGVTLFALVPNTTEFMNAISFALNGNIALR